jgi:hypothetical protein
MATIMLLWLAVSSCNSQDTNNCAEDYQRIQQILKTPVMDVDSTHMVELYTLTKRALSCDTINTMFIRASYRCLAFNGHHERALELALDNRFKNRRRLLDTVYITCVYLRLGDTARAKEIIGRAMLNRVIDVNVEEASDVRGITRTSIYGHVLAQHLGLQVDTTKIAEFMSYVPHEYREEFAHVLTDLDLTVITLVPDRRIDSERFQRMIDSSR